MKPTPQILFDTFRFDPTKKQLWRGNQQVSLQPRPQAVLHYLLEHPGQLITKEELFTRIWAGTYVTKTALRVSVRAIRKALGEIATTPRYIETVGRVGYRWICPVVSSQYSVASSREQSGVRGPESEVQHAQSAIRNPQSTIGIVGREAELRQLQRWLEKTQHGKRQLVFVNGEPGIGKTTVVDLFLDAVRQTQTVRIGRGQCLEQHGEGEAYLPVLEALGQLCRELGGDQVIEVLKQQAPTWLLQMPVLVNDSELELLQRKMQGVTHKHMLQEMAQAIEVLAAEQQLILVFEDLHWSDSSTLELLAYLAQRRERARLLVIGTYRPIDIVVREHPLSGILQELQARSLCTKLRLELLTAEHIKEYVTQRLAPYSLPVQLVKLIHQRTDGNPLFMVNVVEYLVSQELVVEEHGQWRLREEAKKVEGRIPESLRLMIDKHLEKLSAQEQRGLEVASVMGMDFVAAGVAAGLKCTVDEVDDLCEQLMRKSHFLQERGLAEWPDGTLSGRYTFRHALYQSVVYEHIAEARRARLHREIGEREETGYGARAGERAAELAVHFERGRDLQRAVQYQLQAGKNALQRSAHRAALDHFSNGVELLKTLPDTPERARQELALHIASSGPLIATKGFGAPAVGEVYSQALTLCQSVGDSPLLFRVLWGLRTFRMARAELKTAHKLAEQCLQLAQKQKDPALLIAAHYGRGTTAFWLGELTSAQVHFEQGITLYDSRQHGSLAFSYGLDLGVGCFVYAAITLWILGYPDQALGKNQQALALAQEVSHPFSLAFALQEIAVCHQHRGEVEAAHKHAEALIALSAEQGFTLREATGGFLRGWALARQGQEKAGLTQMRESVAAWWATGAGVGWPRWLGMLVEICGKVGQIEEGLRFLDEAFVAVNKTEEHAYEAQLYCLKGQLLLKNSTVRSQNAESSPQAEAEACFQQAIEIARQQHAKSWELRAAISLSRLWRQQGKQVAAQQLLAEVYGWFTEGFDTKDLQEAQGSAGHDRELT